MLKIKLSKLWLIFVYGLFSTSIWAAEQNHTIDPDGTGDYTSLTAWDAGNNADLVAGSTEVARANCTSSSGTADTTSWAVSGWTTDATHIVEAVAASGDEALKTAWDASRYRLVVTDGYCSTVYDADVRYKNLQMQVIYSASANRTNLYVIPTTSVRVWVDSCRLLGDLTDAGNTMGIYVNTAFAGVSVYNTVVYGHDKDGIRIGSSGGGSGISVFNSIVYNTDGGTGIDRDAGAISVHNCAVFGNSTDFEGTLDIFYTASDDGGGDNEVAESGGGAGWPDDFDGAAGGDFTLKATSNLKDAGETDPGGGLYSDDMEDDARGGANWDLALDEIPTAAAGAALPETQIMIMK